MSKTAIFHEMWGYHMGEKTTGDEGAVEVVLSHVEAFRRMPDGSGTHVLLQGGNGFAVRESVDEVRNALEGVPMSAPWLPVGMHPPHRVPNLPGDHGERWNPCDCPACLERRAKVDA